MTSKKPELLPCPWCSGTNLSEAVGDVCCPIEYEAAINCDDCDARGPSVYRYNDKQSAISAAIREWNTRATTSHDDYDEAAKEVGLL